MSNDYLTINGSQINLVTYECTIDCCTPFVLGGIPELAFSRILGKLTALPDPWSGQSCSWSNGSSYPGTTYFVGDVVGYSDHYQQEVGWVREYRALGLRNRADYIPVTDSNTLSDTASFNLPADDLYMIESREGRTVGQCVLDLLSMYQNVTALSAAGIGNFTSAGSGGAGTAVLTGTTVSSVTVAESGSGYTVAPTVVLAGGGGSGASYTATVSGGLITGFTKISAGTGYTTPPTVIISTLPSVTVNDLAALDVIPPFRITFAGERIMQSIESAVQSCHPNHWVYVDVSGNIRFLDQRLFTNNTVTLGGSDVRWMMPSLHRDLSDCYSQLIVRGDLEVSGVTLAVKPYPGSGSSDGGLQEDFGYSGLSNSAAIASWVPSDFQTFNLQTGQDQGSCTCPSTTDVRITSTNTSLTLTANQLDQTDTGQHAIVTVYSDTVTNLQQMFSARVICQYRHDRRRHVRPHARSSLALDSVQRLPALRPLDGWERRLAPVQGDELVHRGSDAAVLSVPVRVPELRRHGRDSDHVARLHGLLVVLGIAPVQSVRDRRSDRPDLRHDHDRHAHQPRLWRRSRHATHATSRSSCRSPTARYPFRPPRAAAMRARSTRWRASAAPRRLRSGSGGITLSTRICRPTPTSFSTRSTMSSSRARSATWAWPRRTSLPARRSRITGNGYTTGWESVALPVASLDIQFNPGPQGTSYVSTLHLSNRKARYTGDIFVRPAVTGQQLGLASSPGYTTPLEGCSDERHLEPPRAARGPLRAAAAGSSGHPAKAYAGASADPGRSGQVLRRPAVVARTRSSGARRHPRSGRRPAHGHRSHRRRSRPTSMSTSPARSRWSRPRRRSGGSTSTSLQPAR